MTAAEPLVAWDLLRTGEMNILLVTVLATPRISGLLGRTADHGESFFCFRGK